jgi:hypothetical protein
MTWDSKVTVIINSSRHAYTEDAAPALDPPQGWRRIDRANLNPQYEYEPFVWIDQNGDPLYDQFSENGRESRIH